MNFFRMHSSFFSLSFIFLIFLSYHRLSYSLHQITIISSNAENMTYRYSASQEASQDSTHIHYILNDTTCLQIKCVGNISNTSLLCNNNSCLAAVDSMGNKVLKLNSTHDLESNYTCMSNTSITVQVLFGHRPIISPLNGTTLFVAENDTLVLEVRVVSLPQASFQWSFNSMTNFTNTTTDAVLRIGSFDSDSVGNYTFEATNVLGSSCVNFSVNLGFAPEIIFQNTSTSYPLENSNVRLLIALEPIPMPSPIVNWYFNTSPVTSSADYNISNFTCNDRQYFSLDILSISRNLTGSYTVEVMNIFDSVNSSFDVTIGNKPQSRVLNGNQTYTTNSSVTLHCNNTADPSVENVSCDMWRFENTTLCGERYTINGTSLSIQSVQLSDAGVYTCTPSNIYGNISILFHLTIHSPPEFCIVGNGKTILVNPTEVFNLTCSARGVPTPRIEWQRNNTTLTDGVAVSYTDTQITSVLTDNTTENTTYTCIAVSNVTSQPGVTDPNPCIIAHYNILIKPPIITATPSPSPPVSPVIPILYDSFVFTGLFCAAILFLICIAIALAVVCLLQQRFRSVKIVELNSARRVSQSLELTIIHPNDNFQTLVPREYSMLDSLSETGIVLDVKVSEIAKYIESLKANDKLGFSDQYEIIRRKSPEHSSSVGDTHDNVSKNRYKNIFCFDHSRVKLTPQDDSHNDFIHANFIDGYNRDKEYIATQGPLENTIDDMWRMVWEYKCTSVVMLTRCMENLKRKCALYWVEEGRKVFFQIAVTHVSNTQLVDYSITKITVQPVDYTGEKLDVCLFQFISWPDFGTPDSPAPLLHFRNKIREYHPYNSSNPMIVHCSAGVGRSGTFIALDMELQKAAMEDKINPFSRVLELREFRNYLVQTEGQYIFLHDAILEGILFGYEDTPVDELQVLIDNLTMLDPEANKTGFELDFKALTSGKIDPRQFSDGNLPVNMKKNRSAQILPFNKNRVKLTMTPGVEGSDYINASLVDSYAYKNVFIVSQAPMDITICDFWRMIFERNVQIVIMLCNLTEHKAEVCAKYWPEMGEELDLDVIRITNEGEEENGELRIVERDLKVEYKKLKSSRVIKHYNFLSWLDNRFPDNFNGLIELLDITDECRSQNNRSPILVHCTTGVGRSGIFCSLYNSIEQATLEECVNLFYVIKKLRLQRIHTIQSLQQYQFSYQALTECLRAIEEKDD